MRIVFVEIRNFRGIKELDWAPSAGVNCLIGPGDSTKTTILDSIELALSPRSYPFADDSDFFGVDPKNPIEVTVTLSDLPPEFRAEDRYGLHLRGWDAAKERVEDEPGTGLEEAISLRVRIDESLEARWSIFNNRIAAAGEDPPGLRFKDARRIATTRLGPYADRHFGWGRQSVLVRLGDTSEGVTLRLAEASRAARTAFHEAEGEVFKETVARAQELSKRFAVPIREKFSAQLDVQSVSITSGGIALHDGNLPLRRLGTGSARRLVSALQHDAGTSHVGLIDEIEHGLEPHRIARLLRFLKEPAKGQAAPQQVFLTTHSPVVIRELTAAEIFRAKSLAGKTTAVSVSKTAKDLSTAQRHLRSTPEAFLSRRVVVGEGRTEQGLLRGLDSAWVQSNKDSFALRGVSVVDGGGSAALVITEHLLDLGYGTCVLLDTDKPAPVAEVTRLKDKGAAIFEWPDNCSTEERVFLDVPWATAKALVKLAEEFSGRDSITSTLNNACKTLALSAVANLDFADSLDTEKFRRALGKAAKSNAWFKDIERGERVAALVAECLPIVATKPLATTLNAIREWVDG